MVGGIARPKSDDKRSAILAAAVGVIVKQGLSAPTAVIARDAGVANGSLFTYFETKAVLFNDLYKELKSGMAAAALDGLPAGASLRDQFLHVWTNWMQWARAHPDHRRALALLGVSDELTAATRRAGHEVMAPIAALMERGRADGPLRHAPLGYVAALMNAVAETTMDAMVQDPVHADARCLDGFEVLWRMLR
jgi:AcrR family transcriptional regulator